MNGEVGHLHPVEVPDLDVEVEVAAEEGRPGLVNLLPPAQGLQGEQAGDVGGVLPNAAQALGVAFVDGVVEGVFGFLCPKAPLDLADPAIESLAAGIVRLMV